MIFREATLEDCQGIAKILLVLGYESTSKQIFDRLGNLINSSNNSVIVAIENDLIIGLCHVQGIPLIASDGYAEIQALVVENSRRRNGIGKQLVSHAISWAAKYGYTRIRLRSGIHREIAHKFYETLGFVRSKASYAFEVTNPII